YSLADPPRLTLQPQQEITTTEVVTLPGVPPGQYWIGLYGLGEVAYITLANPPTCSDAFLRTSLFADGAGMTHYGFITATNVSTTACFLGGVRYVSTIINGAEHGLSATLPAGSELPPLETHLLQPGASAGLVAVTSNGCLDGTVVEQPIGVLALHLLMHDLTPLTIDLTGKGFQSACGFGLSDWGGAPV
ncbi:MAG: hypothetical protein RLZ14_588, partial [Actinomycetota bacterium]